MVVFFSLTRLQISNFNILISTNLTCLVYRWVDESNYIELTRPWYASVLPLPFNYYYPGRYERDAKKYIETMFLEDEEQTVIETHVSFNF